VNASFLSNPSNRQANVSPLLFFFSFDVPWRYTASSAFRYESTRIASIAIQHRRCFQECFHVRRRKESVSSSDSFVCLCSLSLIKGGFATCDRRFLINKPPLFYRRRTRAYPPPSHMSSPTPPPFPQLISVSGTTPSSHRSSSLRPSLRHSWFVRGVKFVKWDEESAPNYYRRYNQPPDN